MQTGQSLASKNHHRKSDIEGLLETMNGEWDALVVASLDKGRKLRQAAAQIIHNKTLEDAKEKMDELNSEMMQSNVGEDLRSCRDLLKKQQGLENEVALWEDKINDLVYTGEEMAQDGHFDGDSILKQGQLYRARLTQFKGHIFFQIIIQISVDIDVDSSSWASAGPWFNEQYNNLCLFIIYFICIYLLFHVYLSFFKQY